MLFLIFDAGNSVGRGNATGVPGATLTDRQIACTPEQYDSPEKLGLVDGKIVEVAPGARPALIPAVRSAQAKIWLHRAGKLEAVKAAAEADPELGIWLSDARDWPRQSPYVAALAAAL